MAEQATELKGVIFDIQENYDKSYTPKTGVNANVELFKHKVILVDKKEGVFFQTTNELMFNKEKCFIGQEICYTQRQSTVEGKPTVFTMCNEREVQNHQQSSSTSKEDISKSAGMSFSYAKDIVIASYGMQVKTVDEYMDEIKKRATEIKNFLLEN